MSVLNSSERPVKLNVPFLSNGFSCVLTFDLEYAGDLPLLVNMITSRLSESLEAHEMAIQSPQNHAHAPKTQSSTPTSTPTTTGDFQQTKVIMAKIDNGAVLLWAEGRRFNDFRLKDATPLHQLGLHLTAGLNVPVNLIVRWEHSLSTNSKGVPYKDVTHITNPETGETVKVAI